MMLSPENYYDIHLKGKSERQIKAAIRGLKNEIGRLKNSIESARYCRKVGKIEIRPSESTQIFYMREYIKRAKQALEELGGMYIPSKAERKATKFLERIPFISTIIFEIGGYFSGITKYTLEFAEMYARLTSEKPRDGLFEEKIVDKDEILYLLGRLYMGEWRRFYCPERYGESVCDGEQWSVIVEYCDGHKAVKFEGSNNYPYNFSDFLNLFGVSGVEKKN